MRFSSLFLRLPHIWQHRTCPCIGLVVSIFLLILRFLYYVWRKYFCLACRLSDQSLLPGWELCRRLPSGKINISKSYLSGRLSRWWRSFPLLAMWDFFSLLYNIILRYDRSWSLYFPLSLVHFLFFSVFGVRPCSLPTIGQGSLFNCIPYSHLWSRVMSRTRHWLLNP